MVICVYTTGFYYDFWQNINNKISENIGLTFFLGNAVVGITSVVSRALLLVINRKEFVYMTNWLRNLYQQGDKNYEELEKTGERILKAWK